MQNPIVSVVIGSYQRNGFIQLAIDSIRADLLNINHEIIVIDGGSTDGSLKWLLAQKDIVTIVQHNRGLWNNMPIPKKSWGYFMNLGFKISQGKYICMLSDDCIVTPKSIINGINLFEQTLKDSAGNVGAVAFYWRNWPQQKEYVVGQTWGDKIFVNHGLYLNSALKEIGYIDEKNYAFYHADGDLCLRLWDAGYTCIDSPTSFIEHYVNPMEKTRVTNLTTQPDDWETYTTRWKTKYGPTTRDWLTKEFNDEFESAKKYKVAINDSLNPLTKLFRKK